MSEHRSEAEERSSLVVSEHLITPIHAWRRPELAPRHEDVVATVASLTTFLALLVSVVADAGLTFADTPLRDFIADHANAPMADRLEHLTYFGAVEFLVPTGMFVGWLLCRWYRSWWPAFVMSAAYVGAITSGSFLKKAVRRPEPFDLVGDVGRSFPSGHTTQTAAVWTMIAILVVIKLRADGRAHWGSRAAPTIAVAANLAVGLAMLYRGSHWLTDTVAGYALGGFWVASTLLWARPELLRAAARYGRGSEVVGPRRSPG
ncbi:MAG: phosphatase PAP2 family protein [Actinobacteria bacterium]|nr:MAG: phosphatase PAP2 family protein [Actinomycetota bacterium]